MPLPRALVLFPLLLVAATSAFACGPEPAVSDNASFQRWRSWCICGGGSPPATLNAAQAAGGCHGAASRAGVSAGATLGTAFGQVIVDSLKPADESEMTAAERYEAQVRERERQENLRNEAILEHLQHTMQTDDDESAILAKRRPIPPRRNAPRAVLKQPLVTEKVAPPADAAVTARPPAGQPARASAATSGTYDKGFEHGSGCFSSHAGLTCGGAPADIVETCLDDYNRGYAVGRRAASQTTDRAYKLGQDDRKSGTSSDLGTIAQGTCSNEVLVSYHSGRRGAPRP